MKSAVIVAAALLVIGAGIWAFWLDPDANVIDAPAPEVATAPAHA